MNDDLFQNGADSIESDPPELGPVLTAVLTITLAKQLAETYKKPWTDKNESEMQEKISELVAGAKERNLTTIRIIVTRPDGRKVSRDLDVDQISRTRSLQ